MKDVTFAEYQQIVREGHARLQKEKEETKELEELFARVDDRDSPNGQDLPRSENRT